LRRAHTSPKPPVVQPSLDVYSLRLRSCRLTGPLSSHPLLPFCDADPCAAKAPSSTGVTRFLANTDWPPPSRLRRFPRLSRLCGPCLPISRWARTVLQLLSMPLSPAVLHPAGVSAASVRLRHPMAAFPYLRGLPRGIFLSGTVGSLSFRPVTRYHPKDGFVSASSASFPPRMRLKLQDSDSYLGRLSPLTRQPSLTH